jgi:hypothetical protein
MADCRKVAALLLVVIVVCVAVFAYIFLITHGFWHHSEIPAARNATRFVHSISSMDVKKIVIILDGPDGVILTAGKDTNDIRRLIDSLKRVTVLNNECRAETTDQIAVLTNSGGSVRICGHFAPEDAPVISPSMRSNDLGAIIYDIFKRKGVRPRQE